MPGSVRSAGRQGPRGVVQRAQFADWAWQDVHFVRDAASWKDVRFLNATAVVTVRFESSKTRTRAFFDLYWNLSGATPAEF